MESILEHIKHGYGNPPVYILQNSKPMKQDLQLQKNDTPRIEYLQGYIGDVLKSVSGYKNNFGLYSVNFCDPQRNYARDFPNSLLIGTQVSSRVKSPLLVPKASRNCRASS